MRRHAPLKALAAPERRDAIRGAPKMSSLTLSKLRFKYIYRAMFPLLTVAVLIASGMRAQSQSLSGSGDTSTTTPAIKTATTLDLTYVRPTSGTKVRNYAFDAFGPYPIVGAAVVAGINQLSNAPPEWHEGAEGYSKRFGSDFAIAAIGTSTRFGLAAAFREDTLYYRCECTGFVPRLRHAALSTLTGRRGEDGHRVFSFPALIAPYAGSMAAVYLWFPDRFGAKDAFRMGNYTLLANVGGNISLEFLYGRSHSLLARMHLNNAHGAPRSGQDQ
jgi:hypothetical protein